MAIIKCKMCGGDLNLVEGASTAECEYCGSVQTVPKVDDEKKLTLFARANRLRVACEFDKATGIYESIVADFPEEGEAYWGLVLCKYGIEYVDDPATGKKIPTCHRSSFDSIMEDSDFEQALENADAVARKVYREEAKTIEEIRKGIIAVSNNEQPYDIFICYKETAENGDRTLDSVLAQDVYDALTGKGYRVFFSRITLEDKLGMEYEPYIFAALNSAKIMLTFGTDYEYFNAVWVKNEWSRFLKLMAKDKEKHLIPCFKGIDAYDMPKEFARLQAQDLGKVGAIQDLLRGIEKILPRQTAQPVVVQERVVVSGSGDHKIVLLLDRGNMALEDGDWAIADSFFEEVLNNDSKNAQAYIGKALAQEKCCTLVSFLLKRKDVYEAVDVQYPSIDADEKRIRNAVNAYHLPNYLDETAILKLYAFDLHYPSTVSGRKNQIEQEDTYWKQHKLLARAEQFATGAVAQNLQEVKNKLFGELSDRVKTAEAEEAKAKNQLLHEYKAHLLQADNTVKASYEKSLLIREQNYQDWSKEANYSNDIQTLKNLADSFHKLGEFKDSPSMEKTCRKRAAEEQQKLDMSTVQVLQLAQSESKKQEKILIALTIVIAVILLGVLLLTEVILPHTQYNKALSLMDQGEFSAAESIFEELGDFKDAKDKVLEAQRLQKNAIIEQKYLTMISMIDNNQFDEAEALAEELVYYASYQDALTLVRSARYSYAEKLLAEKNYHQAAITFAKCKRYKDSHARSRSYWNKLAVRETISAGYYYTVALTYNHTVVAVGNNDNGKCNVSNWRGIISVSAGGEHTVGLKDHGTVIAVGSNDYNQCDVSDWENIVAISAGHEHTVGLRYDGTVVAVGNNDWNQCDVSGWTDIIAISAGQSHTVGLKSDGTVVAVGCNTDGECDVSGWTDIVAISAGGWLTAGLKSDGTVVAIGSDGSGQYTAPHWKNVTAISTGYFGVVGLLSDGTVVGGYGPADTSDWEDIVAVSHGNAHTVAIKSDGTVIADGYNYHGSCNVSGWTDIGIPYE